MAAGRTNFAPETISSKPTDAIESKRSHKKINESDRNPVAHNGLVAGSSAGPTTLRPSGYAWRSHTGAKSEGLFRSLRLGKPVPRTPTEVREGCRAEARRATADEPCISTYEAVTRSPFSPRTDRFCTSNIAGRISACISCRCILNCCSSPIFDRTWMPGQTPVRSTTRTEQSHCRRMPSGDGITGTVHSVTPAAFVGSKARIKCTGLHPLSETR